MNFSRSKVLLKKINAIHDSAEAFEGKFSSLEQDLMLQYLRELYECVSDQEKSNNTVVKAMPSLPDPEIAPSVVQVHATPNPSLTQPLVKKISYEHLTKEEEQPKGVSSEAQPAPMMPSFDSEYDDLFEDVSLGDRSQKFANGPIKDIAKSMGINERILTMNDLFKGDQNLFQETVRQLNSLPTFEDAKDYLINGVAASNDWMSAKRSEKAKVFIKLIRRRYQ